MKQILILAATAIMLATTTTIGCSVSESYEQSREFRRRAAWNKNREQCKSVCQKIEAKYTGMTWANCMCKDADGCRTVFTWKYSSWRQPRTMFKPRTISKCAAVIMEK